MLLSGLLCCIECLQTPRLTLLTRAFIKTAAPNDPHARENLKREHENYLLPSIASGACFRKMYDAIGDPSDGGGISYAAFEWLDTTLAGVEYRPGKCKYAIAKAIIKTVLRSCIILANEELVNTGRNTWFSSDGIG